MSRPERKFDWHAPDAPRYDSLENLMTRHRIVTILKSKTFWAGVTAAAGIVLGADPITLDVIIKAGAAILAGAGIRDSFTKLAAK